MTEILPRKPRQAEQHADNGYNDERKRRIDKHVAGTQPETIGIGLAIDRQRFGTAQGEGDGQQNDQQGNYAPGYASYGYAIAAHLSPTLHAHSS